MPVVQEEEKELHVEDEHFIVKTPPKNLASLKGKKRQTTGAVAWEINHKEESSLKHSMNDGWEIIWIY